MWLVGCGWLLDVVGYWRWLFIGGGCLLEVVVYWRWLVVGGVRLRGGRV